MAREVGNSASLASEISPFHIEDFVVKAKKFSERHTAYYINPDGTL
jgi:hypothetical protein